MDHKHTIIVDMDGTLADIRHRMHHIRGSRKKNWKGFFDEMGKDPVHVWCRELVRAMKAAGCTVAIVTGRPDDHEPQITEWLKKHDIPYDRLCTRRAGDFRPDTVVKREILYRHFKTNGILFVVDDRQETVKMWRDEGLVCLQCNPLEG